jgi:hypothetical protein
MAFERLQELGEEKFRKIVNELMQGTPAMALARTIQQDWKEFQNVAEKTLTQQLSRLRFAMAEGAFGPKAAKQIALGATPQVALLKHVTVPVLVRLEHLAAQQEARVTNLIEKEKLMPLPVGPMLQATNAVFNDYKELLKDIQKMRYDLGLDTFHGVVPLARGVSQTTTLPDGTSIHKQVFEAVTTVEDIFAKRGIVPPR